MVDLMLNNKGPSNFHIDANSAKLKSWKIKNPRRAKLSNTGESGEIRVRDQRIKLI